MAMNFFCTGSKKNHKHSFRRILEKVNLSPAKRAIDDAGEDERKRRAEEEEEIAAEKKKSKKKKKNSAPEIPEYTSADVRLL